MKHPTGRNCDYNRSVREEILDGQVIKVAQQAIDSMYVQKGAIMALYNADDMEELTANLDKLRADRKTEEKKKSRLLGKIAALDPDDDQYDTMYDDLQGVLRHHNQAIAQLDDQIEDVSTQIHTARDGAASFEESLRMFHQSMGAIESWPAEQRRALLHNFLEYVEIYPQPLPDGRLVRKIRFKFPVSVDGGLTYSKDIDMDNNDDTPPEGGPPDGGSPLPPITPYDDSDLPIDDILLWMRAAYRLLMFCLIQIVI